MGTLVQSTTVSNATSANIFGLNNGVTYTVYVTALDGAGTNPPTSSNASGLSPAGSGTPVASYTFFQEYKENGVGCASVDSPLFSLVLLACALLLRRRKRRISGSVTVLLVLLSACPAVLARAEDTSDQSSGPASDKTDSPPAEEDQEQWSPEWVRLEALVGAFNPNPDQGIPQDPFAKVFPAQNQLLWRLQLHANVYGGLGHLSVGLGLGAWQTNGHSLLADGAPSGDAEAFTMYPVELLLGYRADFVYRKWNFPIVPYVKAGWGFVWWTDSKNGTIGHGTVNGTEWHAQGWAMGPEWAGGLEFPLDFLDPINARNLDAQFGINSIGIFGEFGWQYWKGTNGGLYLGGWSASGGVYLAF
jgi:hypothetical protein